MELEIIEIVHQFVLFHLRLVWVKSINDKKRNPSFPQGKKYKISDLWPYFLSLYKTYISIFKVLEPKRDPFEGGKWFLLTSRIHICQRFEARLEHTLKKRPRNSSTMNARMVKGDPTSAAKTWTLLFTLKVFLR